MTLTIVLITILYVLPAISVYTYVKMAHGKNGIWKNDKFELKLFFMMICPVLNIFAGIVGWVDEYPVRDGHNDKDALSNIRNFIGKNVFNIKE